jgi:hypothetical protein
MRLRGVIFHLSEVMIFVQKEILHQMEIYHLGYPVREANLPLMV